MKIFTCFGTGAIVLLSSQALLMKTSITMVLQTTSRGVGSSQKIHSSLISYFCSCFGQVRAVCLDGFSDHCIFVSPYYHY